MDGKTEIINEGSTVIIASSKSSVKVGNIGCVSLPQVNRMSGLKVHNKPRTLITALDGTSAEFGDINMISNLENYGTQGNSGYAEASKSQSDSSARAESQACSADSLPFSSLHVDDGKEDQPDITSVLNNRDLLMKIADLLEKMPGNYCEDLALKFGVSEPSHLASVGPSRRFFTHLAHSKGDLTLTQLKTLVEQDLRLKRNSIFPSIEKDIIEGKVSFTLEASLAELKGNGKHWFYLLENVAYKLLENSYQLPSWKDVADYYKYDHNTIESFSAETEYERPTVKLFQHLSFMENIPTISTLKCHLKDLHRNDIVKLLGSL